MPITSSSRFQHVIIYTAGAGVRLRADTTEVTDNSYRWNFSQAETYGEISAVDSDLEALQDIYASSDGLRDADGNAVSVTLEEFPSAVSSVDDLEDHGYPNPLREGFYDDWIDSLKIGGQLLQRGSVNDDDDIEHSFGLVPVLAASDGGTVDVSLADLRANAAGNAGFNLRLDLEFDLGLTSADVGGERVVRGMLQQLENWRTTGDEIDVNNIGTAAEIVSNLTSRRWRMPQTSTENVDFELLNVGITYTGSENIATRVQVNFAQLSTSPANYDTDAINDLLDSTVVTIDWTEPSVEPAIGNNRVSFQAKQWTIDSQRRITPKSDRILHRGRGLDSGTAYEIPMESVYSRSMEYDDLEDDPDNTGQKLMPSEPHVRTVHFTGSSNGIIRIPEPPDWIFGDGLERDGEIHNVDSTQTCEARDWDNDNIATLLPNERLPFRVALFNNGDGELTRGAEELVRQYVLSGDNVGDFDDVNNFQRTSSRDLYPIPFPTDTPSQNNSEAFTRGTTTFSDDASWPPTSLAVNHGAMTVEKDGHLRYELQVGIVVEDEATGSVSDSNRVFLFRQRGSNVETLREYRQVVMQADDAVTWDVFWEGDVEANDVFFIGWDIWQGTTLTLGNVRVVSFKLAMILSQYISKSYSA